MSAVNRRQFLGRMDIFGCLEACKYRYQLEVADIGNGLLTG